MQRRLLGKTGYEVSEIGLGCWQLGGDFGPVGDETARRDPGKARALDVNFWDTADVYGGGMSESRIGAFKDRKGVFVATKLGRGSQFPGMTGYNRRNVKESLAGSLKRIGGDTLDLAQLHCIPQAVLQDGEIFTIMDDLRDEGLMRHYGASVETIEQGLLCLRHDGIATLQIIFNLFRQDAVTDAAAAGEKARTSASSCGCRWPAGCSRASSPSRRSSPRRTTAPTIATASPSRSARRSRGCRSKRAWSSPTSSRAWRPRACR